MNLLSLKELAHFLTFLGGIVLAVTVLPKVKVAYSMFTGFNYSIAVTLAYVGSIKPDFLLNTLAKK
ncbi:hypothetical protein CHITON_0238 [Thermococcus chitonophagus]|uniref:Uncharacterized protein n=1 Tax=Thermococcus chitonophagus TaxID=54262 RepID=A0A160VQB1_9EURY|nr:hypothetical protein CHITON_0238 [Thermococcus chitonophagus]